MGVRSSLAAVSGPLYSFRFGFHSGILTSGVGLGLALVGWDPFLRLFLRYLFDKLLNLRLFGHGSGALQGVLKQV